MTTMDKPHSPTSQWPAEVPTTEAGWVELAREVGKLLASDEAERERANATPYAEVELLRDAGLTVMMTPVEHGGGGQEWPAAYKVVREVAAGDGSMAHVLGLHYMWAWMPRLAGTPEQVARFDAATVPDRWLWAGAANARGPQVTIRDEGDTLVFDGVKGFATGVPLSDRTVMEGVLEGTDTHLFAVVETDQPGLEPMGNWDNMGQRLTESGGLTVTGVRASWDDVLGVVDKTPVPTLYGSMTVPIGQVLYAGLWLGIARGALEHAVEYARTQGTPWGGYERLIDEPRVLDTMGDLYAKLWSAEALVDQVAQEALPIHRDPASLTERARGEHKIRAGAVKVHCDAVANEITSRIFEVTGARSTATKYGFDRFWRNVRTHTLHDPAAYQRREIGAFVLADEVPEPGWYS